MDFSNSLVYISGTSRGLGKSLALGFLNEGAMVIGIGRTSSIEHPKYEHIYIDLSDIQGLQSFDLPFNDEYDSLILINNSARLGEVTSFARLEEAEIVQTANLNFISPLLLSRKFLGLQCNDMIEKYVLNVGSGAANQPIDGWSMYCSTKAALSMFTQVAKLESDLGRLKCKFLDLAPGIIDTKMQEEIRATESADFSNVEKFREYKESGDLQSADQTAERIIRNFVRLYANNVATDSIRNYK